MAEDPAELEARIVATRAQLASTVEQLAGRLRPQQLKARGGAAVKRRLPRLGPRAPAAAGGEGGHSGGLPIMPWAPIAAGVAGLVALLLVLRRRRAG